MPKTIQPGNTVSTALTKNETLFMTTNETIMLLAFLLFIIFFTICAQLNCFIERRREDRHRRETQNLEALQQRRRDGRNGIPSSADEE
mmetsp:Transcript_19688/g.41364  ORF Transcript_19688/g.41364 Transcript_19688/m.41364 type:complete len:88 (-) Transcript_19688:127-390(-)